MTVVMLSVQSTSEGVGFEQAIVQQGTPFENRFMNVIMIAVGEVMKMTQETIGNSEEVTGQKIEHVVRATLSKIGGKSIRQILEEGGYEFPKA